MKDSSLSVCLFVCLFGWLVIASFVFFFSSLLCSFFSFPFFFLFFLSSSAEEVIFDANDTYELMRCLEEVLVSHRKEDLLRGANASDLEVTRMALVRNLARAMLSPGGF